MKVKLVFDQATDNPQRFENNLNEELAKLEGKVLEVRVNISRDGVHNSIMGVILYNPKG